VTVVLWKILMKSLFDLFDSLQLNIAWKCWWFWIAHIKIERKPFIAHVKHISGSISKN